ncbi:MAG: VWA domain-containing protein, partial [Bacteroidota bacterium]
QPPTLRQLKDWLYRGRQTDEEAEVAAYSATEIFGRKDFTHFSATELDAITAVLHRFARLLYREEHRRRVRTPRSGTIDLRRSIRDNLARGGDLDYFRWCRPKRSRQRITIFCDVSKSMELYSQFLLRFLYGFHRTGVKLEAFVFSTSLTRLTPVLARQDQEASLRQLADLVPQWSGGTDLGRSLRAFREAYGRRYLGRKTTVIVLSDGWDQGDAVVMDHQLRFVRKNCRELVWINPLAGRPGFVPRTRGMVTALPYVDYLTSAHNLETLVELVRHLAR